MKHVKIKRSGKKSKHKEQVKFKTREKILTVILGEGKGCNMLWVSGNREDFSHNENTYFIQDDGIFIMNRIRVTVYIEGISTPISQKYITREQQDRTILLEDGKKKKVTVSVIKGLKYDSKIIDVLLNRGLARIFTTFREDKIVYFIFFMTLIITVLGIISVGVTYYYGS